MSPLFSILIANYNNGAYLLECIDSVLKQSYDNWEIVIVDDKSTDISLEVYKMYSKILGLEYIIMNLIEV